MRLSIRRQDRAVLAALKNMPGYAPANGDYTLAKVQSAYEALAAAEEAELKQNAETAVARATTAAAELAFHRCVLGAKQQVAAQFGEDSNEIEAVGLTRESEIRRGRRRATTAKPTLLPA